MKTVYTNLYEITLLQQKIMRFIDYWAHLEKTPVPQKVIIEEMQKHKLKSHAVIYSLHGLLKLGYIRKTFETSNKTRYVQLRRL